MAELEERFLGYFVPFEVEDCSAESHGGIKDFGRRQDKGEP